MDNKFIQIIILVFCLTLVLNVLAFYYKKSKGQDSSDAISDTKDNKRELYTILKKTIIWTTIIAIILIAFAVIAVVFGGGYKKYEQ